MSKKNSFVTEEKGKIRVRFYFWGGAYLWNVIFSVAKAFHEDSRYDTCVIIDKVLNPEEKIKRVEASGMKAVENSDWKPLVDRPDILFVFPGYCEDGYNKERIIEVRSFTKLIISIPIFLIKDINCSIENFLNRTMFTEMGKSVDYFIFDRLIYSEIMQGKCYVAPNAVEIGNPKFDVLYETICKKKWDDVSGNWKKLEGKKVFLWTTDHEWTSENVTFDLYAKCILDFFSKNRDCALIFRPHPVYLIELRKNGVWTERDLAEMRQVFSDSENMVMDETAEYALAYSKADAVLADMNCGISLSALVLHKPVGILSRYDGRKCIPSHPQVIAQEYLIESEEQCQKFLDMVHQNEDPMREKREKAFQTYISHFDGENGKRIKEFVEGKYFNKCCLKEIARYEREIPSYN